MDRFVREQFSEISQKSKKNANELVTITSPLITNDTKISTSDSKTVGFLPLLVYWRWDYKNTCTLNAQIPINNFSKTVTSMVNKGLKEKLAGQHLELSVDKIPNQFAIDDIGHSIFLLFYAINWENVSIKTESKEFVVSYKLNNNGTTIKTGVIQVPYIDDKQKLKLGYFKSWKTATSDYLGRYDLTISAMSKTVVEKLMTEL